MAKSLHLQQRDIALFSELSRLGLLDTTLIHKRHFIDVSRRRCQQRLRQYLELGLIRSVALTVWYADRDGGRIPTIHCLTERGAGVLRQSTGEASPRFLRSDPRPETLQHRLAIVKVRLLFDDGSRLAGLTEPEWFMEQDCRRDAKDGGSPSRQRVLYHEFSSGKGKFTCLPDAACLLWAPRDATGADKQTTPLVVFWEIDRSTERTAQVAGKCRGYAALLARRAFRRYWPEAGQAAVRVFWVCRSQKRVESLAQALREYPVADCFRFTTEDALRPETAFTAPIWQTVAGEMREIVRLPMSAPAPLDPLERFHSHPQPHVGP